MAKKLLCKLVPDAPDGKPSQLYTGLLTKGGGKDYQRGGSIGMERPMANYIYALYTATDMGTKMDAAGYTQKDIHGEHRWQDVLKFIDYDKMVVESGKLSSIELNIGSKDSTGRLIDYANPKEALDKADSINKTKTGVVATVVNNSVAGTPSYHIIVMKKNARTNNYGIDVEQKLKAWDIAKQAFAHEGVDLEAMPAELTNISAWNSSLVGMLKGLRDYTPRNTLNYKDALTLFSISSSKTAVKDVEREFGSLEAAAQFVNDLNQGVLTAPPTAHQKLLIKNALDESMKFMNVDIDALQSQISAELGNIRSSSIEEIVHQKIHEMNKKYGIGKNEIHKIDNRITSLSDAAVESLFSLQRQLDQLTKKEGYTPEGKAISAIISDLEKEIARKKYYSGTLQFLNEASKRLVFMQDNLDRLQHELATSTDLEQINEMASLMKELRDTRNQFYEIAKSIADGNLTVDESISTADINTLKNSAKKLTDFYDHSENAMQNYAKVLMFNIMKDTMTDYQGNQALSDREIMSAIEMATIDSGVFSRGLYAMYRQDNPLIAVMGTVLFDAKNRRSAKLTDINKRITRANKKLTASGSNSEFMYEDPTHIISDINWESYNNAREREAKRLYATGVRGFDFRMALQDWEEHNTEDRVVDHTNGRTERVPDHKFRKNFPTLTAAQQEYYDEMMELKGELGSLLPAWAQQQYFPPQVRRTMFDAFQQGDIWKGLMAKGTELISITEDDDNYAMNGVVDGDEFQETKGDFNNTPLKKVPVFFMRKLKHPEQLLMDFSTGLQALAGTAVNYYEMNNIADTAEFMGEFIESKMTADDTKKAESFKGNMISVVKDLGSRTDNNAKAIIDGFLDQELYGEYKKAPKNKAESHFQKIMDRLVQYTSFQKLATNWKGMAQNFIMGELQMMFECGAFEFYNPKNFLVAQRALLGCGGTAGIVWDMLAETSNSKGTLLSYMFDPEGNTANDLGHKRYHKGPIRKLLSVDLSFVGYGAGEFLIHQINMLAVLDHEKVMLNGKRISLFDAFEVVDRKDGAGELKLKDGVTLEDGSEVTAEYIKGIRGKIKYVNDTCHGAMDAESKGLLQRQWYGRMAMNFKQWMVEHYSRRFRKAHFDGSIRQIREGYWVSAGKFIKMCAKSSKGSEMWEQGRRTVAVLRFAWDYFTFVKNIATEWGNLNNMQKANCRRALSDIALIVLLGCASFGLGAPEDHEGDDEWWRRFAIYQVRRALGDEIAGAPSPPMLANFLRQVKNPYASLNTLNSLLYVLYGPFTGDLFTTFKGGPRNGQNKYIANVKKYALPFFKDYEQLQHFASDNTIFKIFDVNPSGY